MSAEETAGEREDREIMFNARNRVIYDGYRNSLIEWTLTPEWTRVILTPYDYRGHRKLVSGDHRFGPACYGEINAPFKA